MNTWGNCICGILLAWSKHLFDCYELGIIISIISKTYLKNRNHRIIILVCKGLTSWILSLHWKEEVKASPVEKPCILSQILFAIIDTHRTFAWFCRRKSKDSWKSLDLSSLNLSLTSERVRRNAKWTFPGIAEMPNKSSCCSNCQASEHFYLNISINFL